MEKSFSERVAEAKLAVPAVSTQEAADLYATCDAPVFVDPRPADAIAASTGIIPGALNIPLADIASGKLPAHLGNNRALRVITTCQGGPMGAVAAHELAKQGFTNVRYLAGGTQGWLDAGLPTSR